MKIEKREREKIYDIIINFILSHADRHFISSLLVSFRFVSGLQEFTQYLRKEYSHENIRFWLAVKDLRHSFQAKIPDKVNEIFRYAIVSHWSVNRLYTRIISCRMYNRWNFFSFSREFLAPGAPCEINIDAKTMEKVHQEMKNPNRFTFDSAAEHVYTLLLKKDCYPRFIRSDQYRNLLASGVQPSQKKWYVPNSFIKH